MLWRPNYHKRIVQMIDFISVIAAVLVAFLLWFFMLKHDVATIHSNNIHSVVVYALLTGLIGLIFVLLFKSFNAYNYQRFTSLFQEIARIVKVWILGVLLSLSILFIFGQINISRGFLFLSSVLILILLVINKISIFHFAQFIRQKGINRRKVIVVGIDLKSKSFLETIEGNLGWGLDIIGLITPDEKDKQETYYGYTVIGNITNFESVLKEYNPEEVIITLSSQQFNIIRSILETCEREGIQVRLNSDYFGHITKNIKVDNLYGLNIISFYMTNENEFQQYIKRIIDFIGALIAIILFSPFILVAILMVLITDGRPVFYKYPVIGKNRKIIYIRKIRTMVKNAESLKKTLLGLNEMSGPVFKIKADPRILKVGKLIRKFSIDETPQLFSVLIGDLSLVGPRAPGPHEFERFESWHRRKASIKPGLTCLWQGNGRNDISSFDDWIRLDLNYIDNWSLFLDLKILIKTIPVVILGKGL